MVRLPIEDKIADQNIDVKKTVSTDMVGNLIAPDEKYSTYILQGQRQNTAGWI